MWQDQFVIQLLLFLLLNKGGTKLLFRKSQVKTTSFTSETWSFESQSQNMFFIDLMPSLHIFISELHK